MVPSKPSDHQNTPPSSESAAPPAIDFNSLAIVLTSIVAARLYSVPLIASTATNSGWIPSARDSFVILNMLAFSSAFSVAFLDERSKATRVLRISANMCMCTAFLLLSCAGFSSIMKGR